MPPLLHKVLIYCARCRNADLMAAPNFQQWLPPLLWSSGSKILILLLSKHPEKCAKNGTSHIDPERVLCRLRDVSTTSVLLNKPNWHMNYIAFHTQIQNEHRTFPPSQKKCTRIDIYTVDGNFSYVGKIPKVRKPN